MNRVVRWGPLVALIAPVYPKGKGAGRPLVGLEGMLRIHCLQHGFNLFDPAIEEALYDSRAMRGFVGIDDCCRREMGVSGKQGEHRKIANTSEKKPVRRFPR